MTNSANVFYSLNQNYNSMSDEELLSLIKNEDKYALDFTTFLALSARVRLPLPLLCLYT